MTPESAFALADRFGLMLRTLAGEPLPELPQVSGRHIVAQPIPTPEADAAALDAQAKAAKVWQELADSEGGSID